MSMLRHHLKWHKYYLEQCLDSLIEAANCELAELPESADRLYEFAHSEVAQVKQEVSAILEKLQIDRKYNKNLAQQKTVVISRILCGRIDSIERRLAGRVLP
ncbi:hypothetical protein [Arsukibacterium sp.]|uniref:hypothetical protein n=1 Tax=Arsukibacterium sp. TaxID=1977258 RepID=UPI002FD996F8